MAVSLTWNGRVDLDLTFDKFFNKDHTISAWFMPQFPDSYINPIVGVGSSEVSQPFGFKTHRRNLAFFLMGTGEYSDQSRMFLRVGDKDKHYKADLKKDTWHHVAVVRSGNNFKMYLNGEALGSAINSDVKAPIDAPVRLGHTVAWRQIYTKRPAQFYGLIDDVAIYTQAFKASEIAVLAEVDRPVTGDEPALLAAWLFSKATETKAKLKRKFKLNGSAKKVFEAQPRNSKTDAELLPLPESDLHFELPFPKGQLIFVGQGPHSRGGSHFGARNFPFDFAPVTISPTGDAAESRVRIAGVPFIAVSDGEVVFFDGEHPSGKVDGTNNMFVSINDLPNFYWKHLHWEKGSAKVKLGDKVKAGDVLANAGDTGVAVGNFHLHTALVYFPDGAKPPDTDDKRTVSVPVAFVNYQRLQRVKDEDFWEPVDADIPARPQLLVAGKQLNFKELFDKPLVKQALIRFRENAVRKKLGTHDVHELIGK